MRFRDLNGDVVSHLRTGGIGFLIANTTNLQNIFESVNFICFLFFNNIKIEGFGLSNFHSWSYLCDMNKQNFCSFKSLPCS